MKVQVVTVDRAGGKKLVVQVVYKVNGKEKKQNPDKLDEEVKQVSEFEKKEFVDLDGKLENGWQPLCLWFK